MTRLDLAYEEVEQILSNEDLHHQMKQYKGMTIHQIEIFRNNDLIQNDPGRYITIELNSLGDYQNRSDAADVVAECLKDLLPKKVSKVFIAGLGNQNVTADSLGPDTAEKIIVTAHLPEQVRKNCPKIAVLAPGVMGQTGIETAKIIQSVCSSQKPDIVIAIDALATKSIRRINRVIQITDTGIHPGSGVKNKRMALNEQTLNVKVISIGVATVMSVEHLIEETLTQMNQSHLMEHVNTSELDMVVTPKEMDEVKLHLAEILSMGIHRALIPDYQNY
ncbi:MAG: GPR endopeptidase [Erysipelotrichaceae bacterium]|nr:GPR endopeptidase [Erysipelotrichaceae bacterium]